MKTLFANSPLYPTSQADVFSSSRSSFPTARIGMKVKLPFASLRGMPQSTGVWVGSWGGTAPGKNSVTTHACSMNDPIGNEAMGVCRKNSE